MQGQMKEEASGVANTINFLSELPGMINKTIKDKNKNKTEVLEEKDGELSPAKSPPAKMGRGGGRGSPSGGRGGR